MRTMLFETRKNEEKSAWSVRISTVASESFPTAANAESSESYSTFPIRATAPRAGVDAVTAQAATAMYTRLLSFILFSYLIIMFSPDLGTIPESRMARSSFSIVRSSRSASCQA